MSRMIRLRHGSYGRIAILDLANSLVTHAHSDNHLQFWLAGDLKTIKVLDQALRFDDERAIAINSWEAHSSPVFEKGEHVVFLLLYLRPSWFVQQCLCSGVAPWFNTNSFAYTRELKDLVEALVSMLLGSPTDVAADAAHSAVQIEACVARLVNQTMFAMLRGDADGPLRKPAGEIDPRVQKSLDYMRSNLSVRPRFDDVARASGVSRPHFFSLFREQMMVTPNVYWNTVRIESAIEQVLSTDIPLRDLSYELGFSEPANFSRFFRNQTGVSPGKYREIACR